MTLINNHGDVSSERTADYINRVEAIVKQHFDSLIDSGASASEIKAVAQNFCEAISDASDAAIDNGPGESNVSM